MEYRRAVKEDLPAIMEIVAGAQELMHGQGIDQWQDGYPQDYVFLGDMERGECFVMTEDGRVTAVFTLCRRPEDCYIDIRGGSWLTGGENYAVVHRAAVIADCRKRGIGREIFSVSEKMAAEMGCESLRVDTHRDNVPMRGLLEKCGFTHCGLVYLEGPDKPRLAREAYEKLL